MSDDRAHVLYRMFDVAGQLLYVGITVSVEARMTSHRGLQPWWPSVATIRLEHFPDRASVDRAELEAIRTEAPLHNVARRTDPKPSTRLTPQHTVAIDNTLWQSARRAAKATGTRVSDVIRDELTAYVAKYKHLLEDK